MQTTSFQAAQPAGTQTKKPVSTFFLISMPCDTLFSEYTLTPLLIRVHFKQDNLGIRETLKQKHGTPPKLNWDKNQPLATALYWEKNHDLMILSTIPDQLGRLTYEINIYFADSFKYLIETESTLRQIKKGQTPVERKAF